MPQATTSRNRARYVLGSALAPFVQESAKRRFVHRYTGEHRPQWAARTYADGRSYPVHFADDLEWLNNSYFAVTAAGFLDDRVVSCHSHPTWPNNPELRPQGPPKALPPGSILSVAA
jgi:hypothetical protein